MQKIGSSGYLLLWTLVLSFFIAFTSISIFSQVKQYLERNNLGGSKLENNISRYIQAGSTGRLYIGNNTYIEETPYITTLASGETQEIRFSGVQNINLPLLIGSGGPLFYSFVSFNSLNPSLTGETSSGIIDTSGYILQHSLDTSHTRGILFIQNIGPLTSLRFPKRGVGIQYLVRNIQIIRNKNGVETPLQRKQIIQFEKGDFPSFNYKKYAMEF